MGMAASQARFLGLTARKSNTEYEGQQVNQQRTALANESASLYSKLTNLSVPTPPDITDYYSTEYSFVYGGKTYTMTSLPVRNEAGYNINYSYIDTEYEYEKVSADGLNLDNAKVGSYTLGNYDKLFQHVKNQNPGQALTTDQAISVLSQNNATYYIVNVNDQKQIYKDISSDRVKNGFSNEAQIRYSQTGDISTISIPGLTQGQEIAVSTTSMADDAAYDKAMNAYKKDYSEYEKTMAQINAKTEVLQQQDKTLELRLNQLDTEQQALSTEMDAVQKVIEKNVETTFKTFG